MKMLCDQVALNQRPGKGLLAGLYEFPNTAGHLNEQQALCWVQEQGIAPLRIQPLEDAKHIFSHVEWRMVGYAVKVAEYVKVRSPIRMVTGQELEKEYSLPSAFEAYRPET